MAHTVMVEKNDTSTPTANHWWSHPPCDEMKGRTGGMVALKSYWIIGMSTTTKPHLTVNTKQVKHFTSQGETAVTAEEGPALWWSSGGNLGGDSLGYVQDTRINRRNSTWVRLVGSISASHWMPRQLEWRQSSRIIPQKMILVKSLDIKNHEQSPASR